MIMPYTALMISEINSRDDPIQTMIPSPQSLPGIDNTKTMSQHFCFGLIIPNTRHTRRQFTFLIRVLGQAKIKSKRWIGLERNLVWCGYCLHMLCK